MIVPPADAYSLGHPQVQLREVQIRAAAAASDSAALQGDNGPGDGAVSIYPLAPIGHLRSCFTHRNGTPRQPLLVPAARASLTLRSDLSPEFLDGLEQYSHVWLLYIFHANTDLHKRLGPPRRGNGARGRVRVPRLNAQRVGVLATRSPHRPAPIGLSVARVEGVTGRTLMLSGCDVVDGSPILDVKPYVPFCDALPQATCPPWVGAHVDNEPLAVSSVCIPEHVRHQLLQCWEAPMRQRLYKDFDGFQELVRQVLALDIRSAHNRTGDSLGTTLHALHVQAAGAAAGKSGGRGRGAASGEDESGVPVGDALSAGGDALVQGAARRSGGGTEGDSGDGLHGKYHVVLEGIDVSYDVDACNGVTLRSAVPERGSNPKSG